MKTDFHNYLWVGSKDDRSILIIFQAAKRVGINIVSNTKRHKFWRSLSRFKYFNTNARFLFRFNKPQSLGLITAPQNIMKGSINQTHKDFNWFLVKYRHQLFFKSPQLILIYSPSREPLMLARQTGLATWLALTSSFKV